MSIRDRIRDYIVDAIDSEIENVVDALDILSRLEAYAEEILEKELA